MNNKLLKDVKKLIREVNDEHVHLAEMEEVSQELIWMADAERVLCDRLMDIMRKYE